MDVARARRLGPDAVREGAVRRRRRARACRTASCCTSCRATATSRRPSRTSRSSSPRSKGCRRRRPSGRFCRFPRTRSIRIAAWRRTSASPRPARGRCYALAQRHRARRSSRRPRRCCRASARPTGCSPRRSICKPGQDIAPTDLAELLVDAGFTREDPADEHGEFAVRGGILDVFPAGEAQPVRLEFIGDTIESLRTYDPATQRSIAPIDQLAIVPLRDVLQRRPRRAPIFDYLVARERVARHRLRSATRSTRERRRKLLEQLAAQLRRMRVERDEASAQAPPPTDSSLARRSTLVDVAARRRPTHLAELRHSTPTRSTLARRRPELVDADVAPASSTSACQPAVEMHGRVAGLGRRDPPAARRRRDDAVRRRDAGPRRADDRAAQGIRRLRGSGRARRRRAVRGGARRDRQAVARLPAARRRPADLRRSRRLRGRAPRARAPPLRDQGVSLGSARSEGRRSRRPRRSRHRRVRRPEADRRRRQRRRSSSSCATPATTSCSSRSSGSISSRSTPARRGRRSIGSAARRGSAPRPRSRRPCATWPRSC